MRRFSGGAGADGGGETALQVLSPSLAHPPENGYALVRTRDGQADMYGLDGDGLMVNHASGREIWQVMAEIAWAARDYPGGAPGMRRGQSNDRGSA